MLPPSLLTALPFWVSLASAIALPLNVSSAVSLSSSSSTTFGETPLPPIKAASTPAIPSSLSAPSTSATNPTSNTTANGDAAALSRNQACESSISSWNSASAAYAATITSKPTIPIPYSVSTNYVYDFSVSTLLYVRNYSGPVSTLCDGIPRASGKAFSIVSITTSTQAILSTSFAFESVSPSPTCSYDWRGCELELRQQPGVLPGCAQTGVDFNNANCILPTGAQCRANVGSVGVYYWPSSKDPSALCSSTGVGGGVVTPTSMPSVPVTAVVDGRTFTSPSIYVSFSTIDAAPFCIPTYTGAVVAFPPESISWVSMSSYRP